VNECISEQSDSSYIFKRGAEVSQDEENCQPGGQDVSSTDPTREVPRAGPLYREPEASNQTPVPFALGHQGTLPSCGQQGHF
jgi:hypothetical protein